MSDHRCRRDDRCAEAVTTTAGRVGAPIHTDDGLCLPCTRHTTDAIAALPADYVDLERALERGAAGLAEHVAATKDLPAALRVDVAALASELVRTATTWAEPVAERLNITWDTRLISGHTRPGHALQRATRLLARNMTVLLALRDVAVIVWADDGRYRRAETSDGVTAALTMLDLHQRTRSTLGLTRLAHHLPAPCPRCEHMTLVRDNGDDDVHCRRCGITWAYEDYQRLTLILAQDYRQA